MPTPDDKTPPEFSLIVGGPLYQLFLRSRLARPPLLLLKRRMIAIVGLALLPLMVLAAIGGQLLPGGGHVPLLYDVEALVRLLFVLPILIACEISVHERLSGTVRQFVDRGIIVPNDRPAFDAAVASAMRLRNSAMLEVALLVFVYTVGHWIWRSQIALDKSTWYSTVDGAGLHLTLPGYWYAFVSIPLFQFLLLRWGVRLLIWYRFLWQVSRLKLHLVAIHPDRAAGLGFVGSSVYAFVPLLFAQGALLSGWLADRVFHAGQSALDFEVDVIVVIAFLLATIFAPLCMFCLPLARARREGRREYGLLASQYTNAFEAKWVRGQRSADEPLLGTGDIQSLADLANSYSIVQSTRIVPFGVNLVAQLLAMTVLPLLPLIFTVMPFGSLVMRAVKILL